MSKTSYDTYASEEFSPTYENQYDYYVELIISIRGIIDRLIIAEREESFVHCSRNIVCVIVCAFLPNLIVSSPNISERVKYIIRVFGVSPAPLNIYELLLRSNLPKYSSEMNSGQRYEPAIRTIGVERH